MEDKKLKKRLSTTSLLFIAIIFLTSSFSTILSPLPIVNAQTNVVHFVLTNEWSTINPFLARTRADFTVSGLIYEPLVVVKKDGEPEPWLAKDWSVSPDGLEITFYLNESAKWADGNPVTAHDVKFTWDTMLSHGLLLFLSPDLLASVDVIDDHTVSFILTETYAPYLIGIAQVMIVPKHIWETIPNPGEYQNSDPETAFGSGPMKFKVWRVGEYVELETNDNYWKKEILIDGVVIDLYRVSELGLLALKKGEADVYDGAPAESVPALLGDDDVTVLTRPIPTAFRFIGLNHRIYPNNIREFRKAIDLAIDKKRILEQIDYGYGEVCFSGYIPEALEYWSNPNCVWPGLDMTDEERIETANSMLDELGYDPGPDGIRVTPNGTRLEIDFNIFAGYSNFERVAEMVRDDLENIGVKINVVLVETLTLVNIVYGGEDLLGWDWLPASVVYAPDPDFMT